MITEEALQAAILECQGVRNPNRDTCIMLAALYTIQDHLQDRPSYSYAPPPEQPEQVMYDSGTEFSDAIKGKDTQEILQIMDDAMDAVKVMLPRLYNGIMDKLK